MSIRRYVASEDTTITNAFQSNLITRASASNMGASDSLEVFSVYDQVGGGSVEKSRILIRFPVQDIITDRTNGLVPTSGSAQFVLKMYNAEHPYTLPRDYTLSAFPLSQSWDEGYGLDMETYTDAGAGIPNGFGANWDYAKSGSQWLESGSSYKTSGYNFSQSFKNGYEDLEIDVTSMMEEWISGTLPNNGILVKLSGAFEDGSNKESYYTKKFFARGTEYFYKKPIIEVRWEDAVKDDRGSFYSTSSLLSNEDNTYNIYFYNRYNGKMKNIPSNPNVLVKFYSDQNYTNEVPYITCSVSNPLTGVYKATVRMATTSSALYDKWYLSGSESTVYYRSSFDVYQHNAQDFYNNEEYVYAITNLKTKYSNKENATIRIFSRTRDWNPNIYSVSSKNIENTCIKNLYYRIFRIDDGYEVIGYSTGSVAYTKTSYDTNGNYFHLDMSILEPDYSYGIQLARWDGNVLEEVKKVFKFRVE